MNYVLRSKGNALLATVGCEVTAAKIKVVHVVGVSPGRGIVEAEGAISIGGKSGEKEVEVGVVNAVSGERVMFERSW